MMVIIVLIVAQSSTAFALEYTIPLDDGTQITCSASLDVPSDITQKTNLSPYMIETLLPENLKGLGQALYDGEQTYGINALFLLSIINLESGYGSSSLAEGENNLGGLKGGDGYRSFSTKQECVAYMYDLLSRNYIGKGRTTIESIGHVYCETDGWVSQVSDILYGLVDECNV